MKNFIKRIVRTIITGYVLKWIKNKIEGNSKENNLKRSIHFILENRPFIMTYWNRIYSLRNASKCFNSVVY